MFDKETIILLLIMSLSVNYPILRDIGLALSKVLFLVTGKGRDTAVIRALTGEKESGTDSLMNLKELKKIMSEADSEILIHHYFPSKQGDEILKIFACAAKTGMVAGNKISAVPIVVSEEVPLGWNLDDFFIIYLDEKLTDGKLDFLWAVPPDDQISVVFDKIRAVVDTEETQEKRALLAAACFLYPRLVIAGRDDVFNGVLSCVLDLIELDDNAHDVNGLEDAIIKELYRWQGDTGFCNVSELPYLEMEVQKNLDQYMLFDEMFIYITEGLFRIIMEALLKTFSTGILKKALAEAGILCPNSTNTYSVKVGYYDLIGQYHRERMLRLKRSRLSVVGELEFIERCIDAKEEKLHGAGEI